MLKYVNKKKFNFLFINIHNIYICIYEYIIIMYNYCLQYIMMIIIFIRYYIFNLLFFTEKNLFYCIVYLILLTHLSYIIKHRNVLVSVFPMCEIRSIEIHR